MKIGIETYASNSYKEILEEYGEVLIRFGLSETENGYAEICIDCLGDVFNLHEEIEHFINNSDKPLPYRRKRKLRAGKLQMGWYENASGYKFVFDLQKDLDAEEQNERLLRLAIGEDEKWVSVLWIRTT